MSFDEFKELPRCKKLNFGESTTIQEVCRRKNLIQIKFIESILDFVDQYWNGSKSLHYHDKFHSLIFLPLENYEKELSSAREVQVKVLEDKVARQQQQINKLQIKLQTNSKKSNVDQKASEDLIHLQQELESKKSHIKHVLRENTILRDTAIRLEAQLKSKKKVFCVC